MNVAAVRVEAPQDVPLDAEVVGGDPQPRRRASAGANAELDAVGLADADARSRHSNARSHVTPRHEVGAFHLRNGTRLLDELPRGPPARWR